MMSARALVARVGVNDGEAGGRARDPGAVVAAELAEVVADGVEDPVARLVEVGDHHRGGGSSKYSRPVAQIPMPTEPTHSSMPVVRLSRSSAAGR